VIVRVVTGRVLPRHASEFRRFAAEQLEVLRRVDGLLDILAGRQAEPDGEPFVFVTLWRDLEAIYQWLGEDDLLSSLGPLRSHPDWVDRVDIQHYESFATRILGPAGPDPEAKAWG
jgi:heme-degrading monooxygenase HmoA